MRKIALIILLAITSLSYSQMSFLKSDTCPIINSSDTLIITYYMDYYKVSATERYISWYDYEETKKICADTTFVRTRNFAITMNKDDIIPVGQQNWTWLQTLTWCTSNGPTAFVEANKYILELRGY